MSSSVEPTPEEIEAGASLMQAPERLESRATDEPAPPPPAVQGLIERHGTGAAVRALPPTNADVAAPAGAPHRGLVLSVGFNLAIGPIHAVGGELNVGVVMDMTEPSLSLFASDGWGTAEAPGISAGISEQAAYVDDIEKFWGSGVEIGVNTPVVGAALNYTTPAPGASPEFNGFTISAGPSIGGDIHTLETTTDRVSLSLSDIKDALKRAASLPGPHRFGP